METDTDLKKVLEVLVKGIVQTESEVKIEESAGEILHGKQTTHFLIKVKKEEFSLLVGKGGSTIKSLRTIMSKLAGKQKKMVFVDLDEK
jgi:predicted RNA-binding protein YlqC (UPF0109 family)